jgi:hypothetical protein
MSYDVDGTQVFLKSSSSSSISQVSSATVQALNGELGSSLTITTGSSVDAWLAFLFPQRRDVVGYFYSSAVGSWVLEWSNTTTTGADGSWSTLASSIGSVALVNPSYRTGVATVSALNASALRFRRTVSGTNTSGGISVAHLYGSLTSGLGDRLAIWHPTLSQEMDYFDFADITRGVTSTVQFRVKNMSSSLTASGVQVSSSVIAGELFSGRVVVLVAA